MDFKELLRCHDHPTHWECPPGFDYRAAVARFQRFKDDLSASMGTALNAETGIHIQDASFFSQIFLPIGEDRLATIRFSKFGEMVTVSEYEPVPEKLLETVRELIAKHGYVYVPFGVLDVPYDGLNPGVTGIDSWWVRYFDWV